ncbi:dopamine D2-like receptor [Lytechinus variegatus]|uniref:dopamine D2-like receptor n=1 Tax=Lytechinus variegatus TaxID=7654 RepID=UPI001BB1D405|nr:dopamine D2-like receptor [Lytechinus variegatus]
MGMLEESLAWLEYTMSEFNNQTSQGEWNCQPIRYPWTLIISLLIMMVIMSAGVLGNVLVCVSMYTCRSLRTANNALLLNLAAADLLASFLFTPLLFTLVIQSLVSHQAVMPRSLCVLQGWLRFVCSAVQQITLSSISAQRYAAIVHPLKRKGTKERVLAAVVISWLISVSISIAAIYLHSSPIYELCPCSLHPGTPTNLVDMYLLGPLGTVSFIVVITFYAMIFRTVRKHVKEKSGSSLERSRSDITANKRTLAFTCCNICGFRAGMKSNVVAPIDGNSSIGLSRHDLLQGSSSLESLESTERQNTRNMSVPEIADNTSTKHGVTDTENNLMPHESVDHDHGPSILLDDQVLDKAVHFSSEAADNRETRKCSLSSLETNNDMNTEINDSEQDTIVSKCRANTECGTDKSDDSQYLKCEKLEDTPVFNIKRSEPRVAEHATKMGDNSISEKSLNSLIQGEDVQDNGASRHVLQDVPPETASSVEGKGGLTNKNRVWLASEILVGASSSIQDSTVVTQELSTKICGDVCMMNPRSRERGRRKIEAKTAKRALFIIAAFIICWFPMNIVTYVDITKDLPVEVKILFLSVSFLSAVINPIIYTFINTAYRNEFKRLLKKICHR